MPAGPRPSFGVLVVCTGNICRSALTERLGRAYLDETLGDDAADIHIASAGTHAVVGSAMHPDSALVLQGFGGEPEGFTARQLTDEHIMDADLVLTMTRTHRGEVLTVAPRALSRAYTLREAADLVRILGADLEVPPGPFLDRARALIKAMNDARSRRQAAKSDDIADPMGRPLEAHQAAGEAIAEALIPLLDAFLSLRAAGMPG